MGGCRAKQPPRGTGRRRGPGGSRHHRHVVPRPPRRTGAAGGADGRGAFPRGGRRAGGLHRASLADDALAAAESEVILSEDRREVLAALRRLPRRRREVLVLRYYLGLSEAEIAAVLGISSGTVKSTAARAMAALARHLGEH